MKNIMISDASLRAYGRVSALALNFKEKLEIAKKLCELNLDIIELGPVTLDKADEVLIKTICAVVKSSVISCSVGLTEQSVEKNYQLIAGAKKKRLLVNMPISAVQMEYVLKAKPKAVVELLKSLTEKSVSLCEDVEVSLEDATRAEPNFLYQAVKTAIDAGAKSITLTDIEGSMLPVDFGNFILDVYKNVPELKSVKLGVQCSNDFGMAIACLMSAIEAGANVVKLSSIGGLNLTSVGNFVHAVEYIGSKKGFSCKLNKTAIQRIEKQIAQISSDKPSNSILGEVVSEQDEEIAKNLTVSALSKIIKKRGYDLSSEDIAKVHAEYVRVADKKTVNTKELDVIIASTALQVPETYTLTSFIVNSSNVLTATASITLEKDGKEISGLSYGNGAIDAAFLAIENVTGRHFDLDDFQINSVTAGKEAMGETVVKLRSNGKIYSGRGVSTDVVGASIRAYVNALNKIVYGEVNE